MTTSLCSVLQTQERRAVCDSWGAVTWRDPPGKEVLTQLPLILSLHLCSYYPLYPPQEDMAIDYESFCTYAQLPVTPDVFIVPSELRYFVKVGSNSFPNTPDLVFDFLSQATGTHSSWVR